MGTRSLICVVLNGEYKVAQYCQWDGYPRGQGAAVLDFLTNKMDREKFIQMLHNSRFAINLEIGEMWKECGADGSGMVSLETSNIFKNKYPQLHRDTGAAVLEFIQNATSVILLADDIDFAQESSSCKWVYVVDLDTNVFEVYEGHNTEPVTEGRFVGEVVDEFGPVKLAWVCSLNDLPDEETFIKVLEGDNSNTDREEEVAAVLLSLREHQSSDNKEMLNHICNYMDANFGDFLKAIED